jgi:hypothetical protein
VRFNETLVVAFRLKEERGARLSAGAVASRRPGLLAFLREDQPRLGRGACQGTTGPD